MKNFFILFMMICICYGMNAQINKQNTTVVTPVTSLKTIPVAKATVIRKDVIQLKSQLVQLSDSISISKSEIDAIVDKINKVGF